MPDRASAVKVDHLRVQPDQALVGGEGRRGGAGAAAQPDRQTECQTDRLGGRRRSVGDGGNDGRRDGGKEDDEAEDIPRQYTVKTPTEVSSARVIGASQR